MSIAATLVKELREKTGAGMMDCRKALLETQGDIEKAVVLLRQKGMITAEKKAGRQTTAGRTEAYIHFDGKVGVLIEVNCETDFVGKTEAFRELCKNLAMQVAANSPRFVSRNDVPESVREEERNIYRAQVRDEGKPDHIVERIIEGKLDKFYQRVCLLDQPYVKEDSKKVQDEIKETIAKVGENIVVKRFCRYALGE
ncbi:MAG: translation elongation factor Ts [Armatimonadetes bacterium]|nr:translation elongation factor Ts [Armatimonadota bacterium]